MFSVAVIRCNSTEVKEVCSSHMNRECGSRYVFFTKTSSILYTLQFKPVFIFSAVNDTNA